MAQTTLDVLRKIKYELDDREWWLSDIMSCISVYSDHEHQKKIWVDKTEVFWSTALDMYEILFIYAEFDYFVEDYAENFFLNEEQIVVLNKFRSQLKTTPFMTVNPKNILDDPDWQHVVDEAKNVLKAFDYKKP